MNEEARLDLYWIPLGAGSRVVRASGRAFEVLAAAAQRRQRRDLYHSALVAHRGGATYFLEMAPVPTEAGERGVVGTGAVGARALGRFRLFRYEVRRWRDGTIPDLGFAVGGPLRLTVDPGEVDAALQWIGRVPTPVWGRDGLGAGEMWNSNSVIAWVLERAGLLDAAGPPPGGGRAPGWTAGVVVARREPLGQRSPADHPVGDPDRTAGDGGASR